MPLVPLAGSKGVAGGRVGVRWTWVMCTGRGRCVCVCLCTFVCVCVCDRHVYV